MHRLWRSSYTYFHGKPQERIFTMMFSNIGIKYGRVQYFAFARNEISHFPKIVTLGCTIQVIIASLECLNGLIRWAMKVAEANFWKLRQIMADC